LRRIPPTSAARGIIVLALGLLLAAFLDAEGLRKQAEIQPQGFQRRLAIDLTRPLVHVSRTLHLTTPRHEVQVAIGRQNEDVIDTRVELPPPAGPSSRAASPPTPSTPGRQPTPTTSKPPPQPGHASGAGTTPSTTPTTKTAPEPVFTAAHPLRIWVAGDSLAEVPGEGLERLPQRSLDVLPIESRLSTGLARPDLYNWFTRFQDVIAQLHPRVAVLSFGADDAHSYMSGVPAGRAVGPFGSPSWKAEYRRRVDGVTRELAAAGIYTVWLGLPIPAGPGFRRSFPVVNSILESVVKAHPSVSTYVDTWRLLEGAHGRYTPYLRVNGALTLMRLPDGVHYTAAAGDLIARQTLAQLRRVFRLR
jgi:uncharacterized protein